MTAGLVKALHHLADEFEARQRVKQRHAVVVADGACHLGGHDALAHRAVLGQGARLLPAAEDVMQQQAADLVARQGMEGALRVLDAHAQAVTVRIRAEDDRGAHLVRQWDGQLEGGRVLRVGGLDGGEIGVGQLLLGHHGYAGEPGLLEGAAHRHIAAAVQGGIDDVEVAALGAHQVRRYQQAQHHADVIVVHFLVADDVQQPILAGGTLVHGQALVIIQRKHQPADGLCSLGRYLRAVGAVHLVAVVLRGVVAGGDGYAGCGLQVPHGVADNGHRAQRVKQHRLHSTRREHQRRFFGKLRRHAAAVVANDHAPAGGAGLLLEVVG